MQHCNLEDNVYLLRLIQRRREFVIQVESSYLFAQKNGLGLPTLLLCASVSEHERVNMFE